MWLAMSTVTDAISCPRKFDCNESLTSFDIGPAPSYITIVSSILSCLGSILIVAAYFVLKDMRTGAQKIITLLAIADFISAAGYIFGSINFLTHFNHTDKNKCEIFQMLCEIQASITSWSSIASFCWTLILAFYFLMVIVYNRAPLAISLLPLYNLIAWGFPIFVIIPLAALRKLGYAPYAASNWCYVKDERYSTELENNKEIILFVFVAGKMWEILTYIVVTVIYIVIKIHFDKTHRRLQVDPVLYPRMGQVEKRLLAIPLLFILLRMWGTVQFFYSLGVSSYNQNGCIPHAVQTVFLVFGILQAIGDPGQGWGNAILYVFMSPTIRERLFAEPWDKCFAGAEKGVAGLLESESDMTKTEQSVNLGQDRSENTPLASATGYRIRKYTTTTTTEATTSSQPQDMRDVCRNEKLEKSDSS